MNLIIDVGNTLIKFAVFQGDMLLEKKSVKHEDTLKTYKILKNKYPTISKGIVSTVGKLAPSEFNYIKKNLDLIILDNKLQLPFKNLYQTPQTLGVDRIALVASSVKHFPNSNVLIIDAGTCITYDLCNF